MNCPKCGAENREAAKFCSVCGSDLAIYEEVIICPRCQGNSNPNSRFCDSCGLDFESVAGETPRTLTCPECGALNMRSETQCVKCDADLIGIKNQESGAVGPARKKIRAEVPGKRNSSSTASAVLYLGVTIVLIGLVLYFVSEFAENNAEDKMMEGDYQGGLDSLKFADDLKDATPIVMAIGFVAVIAGVLLKVGSK